MNITAIKKLILDDADYWGTPMSEGRLNAFANQLSSFEPVEILKSMMLYRGEAGRSRMPMPADLIARMNQDLDSDSKGKLIASRVYEAVGRFGYANPSEAKAFVGDAAWRLIARFGGWTYICQELGVSIPVSTFIAQMRDIATATDKASKIGIDEGPIALSAPNQSAQITGNLEKLDPMKLISINRGENGNR